MKRTYDSSRFIVLFVKAGLIAAIAAVLLAPTTIKAGSEAGPLVEPAWPMQKRASFDALPLPPIPHLETMPWLARERTPESFRIDTLLGPKFELMRSEIAGAGASVPLPVTTPEALDLSSRG
jgi:hypothetical protein